MTRVTSPGTPEVVPTASQFAGAPWRLFAFEADLRGSLRRFPMIARHKLTVCARRIALEDWQRLSLDERVLLAAHPIESVDERAAYCSALDAMMLFRCGCCAAADDREDDEGWGVTGEVPQRVLMQCRASGVPPIPAELWSRLTELERFSLWALSRPGHRNRGFAELELELRKPARQTGYKA